LNNRAKGGGFLNPVPGKAVLDTGSLSGIAEARRTWSALDLSSAAMLESELIVPENAM